MQHQLTPPVDLRIRLVLLVVLLAPVFLASRLTVPWRIVACILPLALAGTYRISTIKGDWLTTKLYMGFIPVIRNKCKLKSVVHIGTNYGASSPGFATFILFGPIQFIFGYIFDLLIPSIGGPYELSVETGKGREFTVWQGFSQNHFEKNLQLLTNQTGATIKPR